MSLILVVEQEGRYVERIHDALVAEGWRVKVVNGGEAALQAAAAEAPQLVLVNSEVSGARHLLESFARRRGGPGSVALVPEHAGKESAERSQAADERLAKPFTDQELRLLVRRSLSAAREARPVPGRDGRQLTSEEIFGDVLAEVEGGGGAPPPARRSSAEGDVERRLEETLSGVRARSARPPKAKEASVDELTRTQTLLVDSERLASIGLMAAGIVHEINNPVAYVAANLDYSLSELQKAGFPEIPTTSEIVSALKDSAEGVSRIREIVKDMREMARPRQGEGAAIRLCDVVQTAIRIARFHTKGRAEVVSDVAPDIDVQGHAGSLIQVFLNLIVNAAQSLAAAKVDAPRIEIGARAVDGTAVVEVSDNGLGISPTDLDRIFSPFFSTKAKGQGVGLGLFISRDIVLRHGGEISVESRQGEGATFRVCLPQQRTATPQTPATSASGPFRRSGVLLLVDDDRQIIQAFRRYYGRDHKVMTAASADEAWALVRERQDFDLIICDVGLPGMNGLELFKRIAKAWPRLGASFVFITGVANEEARAFTRMSGHVLCEKPFDMSALEPLLWASINAVVPGPPEQPADA